MILSCHVGFICVFQVYINQRLVRVKTEKNGENGTKRTLCYCHDELIIEIMSVSLKPRHPSTKEEQNTSFQELMPISLASSATYG